MPEFIIKLGDQVLHTRRVDKDLLRIGRSRDNDVVLENLSVSREHAQVRVVDEQYILTDLNSANGTLVNGVRITKTEIVDQDVITIGKHKLHFNNPVVPPAEVSASDVFRTVMVEPKAEAMLVVNTGRLAGREFKITRFETSLGKAPTNDIVLTDDWLLGKKQALILRKGNNAFEVHDLGGIRKVRVNGEVVTGKAELKDGDTLELGGVELTFSARTGEPRPTGRIPSELPADTPVRAAGRLMANGNGNGNGARGAAAFQPPDESLDMEEGYRSFRINLRDESLQPADDAAAAPQNNGAVPADALEATSNVQVPLVVEPAAEPVAAAAEEEIREPDGAADEAVAEESDSTPVETPAAQDIAQLPAEPEPAPMQRPSNGAAARAKAEAAQNGVFDDVRSTTRRKRKHHQRAERQQVAAMEPAPPAAPAQRKPAMAAAAPGNSAPVPAPPDLSATDKEIAIWEEALKNPSPAIKRQAARMLKKLTGRDYEV